MTGRECRDAMPPRNGSTTPGSVLVFDVAKRGTELAWECWTSGDVGVAKRGTSVARRHSQWQRGAA